MGSKRLSGSICASSRMMTEPAMLCSLRQREERSAKRDRRIARRWSRQSARPSFPRQDAICLWWCRLAVRCRRRCCGVPTRLVRPIRQRLAKLSGILFDDAGERDDVNYAPHVVLFGVFQRERHGSESFAAAGRHGEREQSLRLCRLFYGIIENFRCVGSLRRHCVFRLRFALSLGDTSSELVDKLIEIVL